MKICPVGTELFHADADRHDEAMSRFPPFYKSAYKWISRPLRDIYTKYDICPFKGDEGLGGETGGKETTGET